MVVVVGGGAVVVGVEGGGVGVGAVGVGEVGVAGEEEEVCRYLLKMVEILWRGKTRITDYS